MKRFRVEDDVELIRSGSRQDCPLIRFNLNPQTLASFGYGGVAPHASLRAGSKVLLGERVAPLRVVFPPNRRRITAADGDSAGMF
jgi:hypothetical protein